MNKNNPFKEMKPLEKDNCCIKLGDGSRVCFPTYEQAKFAYKAISYHDKLVSSVKKLTKILNRICRAVGWRWAEINVRGNVQRANRIIKDISTK